MRLPLKHQALISAIAQRQKKIEKEQLKYKKLITEAEQKKKEQEQLISALKSEVPAYEKAGMYSIHSFHQQRRKQAIVLHSINFYVAQVEEIKDKLNDLEKQSEALKKQRQKAVKKQNKMTLYFERKALEKELYIERLEQNEIQEIALYGSGNI
ncbi:TPA: type III secretion protein [Proteus mirabilis]|uniref:type III secretion protein n=1 Tax=Proteus mirabilis TaxID=584 RepID=UPI00191AC68C|nr:type III secretion protein [Proteus mirabilis]EKW0402123.1 type III secretion protein [Proteus mirabilis]EKW4513977.1 type III secretion protein [Proteus mirabilis]ELL8911152.1 type III secretion protein [Proteus mirabilis]MBN7189596.1 type III secretion protein [Proteus mirabilis]MBN7243735.1 type III secretion protein [Proteus mirabilis]